MVVVSAPGKVLLAGGYLILDRPHTGTVLALDARFFSAVEMRPPAAAALPGEVEVSVASPQFGELRHYVYSSGPAGEDASLRPTAGTAAQPPNRYVEVPLLYAITAARALAADAVYAPAAAVERGSAGDLQGGPRASARRCAAQANGRCTSSSSRGRRRR